MNNIFVDRPAAETPVQHADYARLTMPAKRPGSLWWGWLATLAVIFFVQAITLDVLPHLQQDEAQITDYGRLALHPHSDWSVTWLTARDKPLLLWTYLGPLLAELGYQLGGDSGLGPRIASLLGGLFAATMAIGWLLSRGVPRLASWCLAVAFLLDPLFDLSQRMARVDSWVFGCCIGACWMLRRAASESGTGKRPPIMLAGVLSATALFLWPSAIFLYPLVAIEFIHLLVSASRAGASVRVLAAQFASFAVAALVTAVLLLIPVWNNLQVIFADMASVVSLNVKSSSPYGRLFILFDYHPWAKLVKAFVKTLSPLFPLLAIAGLIICRDRLLALAAFVALAAMIATLVYEFRALYLLPYFLVLVAGAYARFHRNPPSPLMRNIAQVVLIGMVVWSVGISLGLRTYLGLQARAPLSRAAIEQAAVSAAGAGNHKVLLAFTYEFYFAGRSLGWQLYTPYIQFGYDSLGNWTRENDYEPKQQFEQLLSRMDYAIFSKGGVNSVVEQQLATAGLTYSTTVLEQPGGAGTGSDNGARKSAETFLWFLRGKTAYGPFVVYKRQAIPAMPTPVTEK